MGKRGNLCAGNRVIGKERKTRKMIISKRGIKLLSQLEIDSNLDMLTHRITDGLPFADLTVALFQANAATGDMALTPEAINDNNTAVEAGANAVNQYAEIDFGAMMCLQQFRNYGSNTLTDGTGKHKIQYYDTISQAWVDWKTDIPTRKSETWTTWEKVSKIYAQKIRIIVTSLDSGGLGVFYMKEYEIKY